MDNNNAQNRTNDETVQSEYKRTKLFIGALGPGFLGIQEIKVKGIEKPIVVYQVESAEALSAKDPLD